MHLLVVVLLALSPLAACVPVVLLVPRHLLVVLLVPWALPSAGVRRLPVPFGLLSLAAAPLFLALPAQAVV